MGILLGSITALGLSLAFKPAQIAAGYWRLPFLLGGLFGFCAMLLRRWLAETPVFEEIRQRAELSRELPLRAALRGHGRAVAASMVATWMASAAIVVVILMTPALLQNLFALPPFTVQLANLAATAGLGLSVVAVGVAIDRFGVRRVAVPMLLLLIASTYALYWGAGRMPSALLPLYVLAGIGTGGLTLVAFVMVRAFPPPVRFSGVAFSYNIVYAIFGGITPPLVLWLAHLDRMSPAHYLAAATIAGLCAIFLAPTAADSDQTLTHATVSQ